MPAPCSPSAISWPVGNSATAPEGPSCEQVLGVPLLAPGGACLGALLLGVGADGLNIGVVRTGLLLARRLACDPQGDLAGLSEALASVLLPAALHVGLWHPVGATDSECGSELGGSDSEAVGYSSDGGGLPDQLLDREDAGRQLPRRRRAGGGSDNSGPGDDGRGQRLPPRHRQRLQQSSGQVRMGWLLRFDDDRLERRFLDWHAGSMMKVGVGSHGGWVEGEGA